MVEIIEWLRFRIKGKKKGDYVQLKLAMLINIIYIKLINLWQWVKISLFEDLKNDSNYKT